MEVRTAVAVRAMALLIIAPICSVGLLLVLYVALGLWLPRRVAVHTGPDGVACGPSSCSPVLAGSLQRPSRSSV